MPAHLRRLALAVVGLFTACAHAPRPVTIVELASILEGTTNGVRANRVQELVVQLRERTKRPTKSNAPENTASG